MLDPLVTGTSLELSPLHVIAVTIAAGLIGLAGVGIRRFLMAYADELLLLWHELAPRAAGSLLRRRTMPASPWFCATCHSRNGEAVSRCYSCGGRRETSEAVIPEHAEPPAGPSAGRSQRTRHGH